MVPGVAAGQMRVKVGPVVVLVNTKVKKAISILCHCDSIAMAAPGLYFSKMLDSHFVRKVRQRLHSKHLEYLVAKGLVYIGARFLGDLQGSLVLDHQFLLGTE